MKFIKINESFSEVGQLVNCFFSFFVLEEILYSVHRRHRLFSFDNWPQQESDNLSQIVLTEYINKNPNEACKEETLCNGNDPRVVSDGNRAFILSEGAVHSNIKYKLTIFPENKNIELSLGNDVVFGKNWQPIFYNNELYVIDSISPFIINKIDIQTGLIEKVNQIEIDFELSASHDKYPILRGGSNAIVKNDIFYGWGHATTKPYSHIPFIWEYDGKCVTTSFINIYTTFKKDGYAIVDPTSFIEWDEDNFALGVSCSNREWFHSQKFLNGLLIIKKEDFFNKRFYPLELGLDGNVLFFHCSELDSLIDSSIINGGRYNEKKKGCLVCGPSKEIDLTKKWTIELCYSSPEKLLKQVGKFDIFLTINGIDKQVLITKIYGTEGKSTRVKLTLDYIENSEKALIQTRVFTKKRVSVTAYFFELNYE